MSQYEVVELTPQQAIHDAIDAVCEERNMVLAAIGANADCTHHPAEIASWLRAADLLNSCASDLTDLVAGNDPDTTPEE